MCVKNKSETWRTYELENHSSRGREIKLGVPVKKDSAISVMLYYKNKKTKKEEKKLVKMLTLVSSEW